LKEVGSLIPPAKSSAQVSMNTGISGSLSGNKELCDVPLYSDILTLPYGLKGYFDFEQGMACARALNKPVFLDFKGHACSNCKKMEAEVWSDPAVLERLSRNFVIIALYVDDRYQMPREKWITSPVDGKVKKTIGARNADLQIEKFRSNTQPLYAITDPEGNLLAGPLGAEFNISKFIAFLDRGMERFHQK
ncbi:MAG TPA: thioredoxin family protein, partial [Bacteroidales bacterium]|nr:thioredoxin family protein [Bacteroidales bacterium]